MRTDTVKTDKKAIAKFMGYETVRIGYYGSDETKWQVKNREWLDRPDISEQYGNSVGNYFVNIERNEIIDQDDIDYENSWNDLMPVVAKVRSLLQDNTLYDKMKNDWDFIVTALSTAEIEAVRIAALLFITKLNNSQTK